MPTDPTTSAAVRWANVVPSWIVLRVGLWHRHMPFWLVRWLTLRTKDDALAVGVDYAH